MDVGIRELKQNLSKYIDRVDRGEVVRVTDRGIPKAIISPIAPSGIERGIDEGWIRPARRVGLSPVKRALSHHRVRDVLAEDRE